MTRVPVRPRRSPCGTRVNAVPLNLRPLSYRHRSRTCAAAHQLHLSRWLRLPTTSKNRPSATLPGTNKQERKLFGALAAIARGRSRLQRTGLCCCSEGVFHAHGAVPFQMSLALSRSASPCSAPPCWPCLKPGTRPRERCRDVVFADFHGRRLHQPQDFPFGVEPHQRGSRYLTSPKKDNQPRGDQRDGTDSTPASTVWGT